MINKVLVVVLFVRRGYQASVATCTFATPDIINGVSYKPYLMGKYPSPLT